MPSHHQAYHTEEQQVKTLDLKFLLAVLKYVCPDDGLVLTSRNQWPFYLQLFVLLT
jgi:hypothetical protein